jgi:CheY-like chemotaxis protein
VQVFLPRSGAEAVEEADMEEPLAPGTGRILLVDDEPALAEISAEMLESLGYRVTVRTGGAEALDAFAAAPDSFDLLLADQVMPGLTGLELADRVLEARPGLPVVLCTGFSEHLSYEQARARGVSRILVKPVPKSRLARTIREALAGC